MNVIRALRLDEARWSRIGPSSFWAAFGTTSLAAVLWSFNRFGGTAFDAPRHFVRMGLLSFYGWFGLALGVWAVAATLSMGSTRRTATLLRTVTMVGVAHLPVVVFGVVVFVAASVLRLLGPGLVSAVTVFGLWFPAVLVVATRHSFGSSIGRALIAALGPYVLWMVFIGRPLLQRVQHLL